jgi:hypothetical protein
VGYISKLLPDEIRRVIRASNTASAQGSQKYVVWENRAIHSDYDFPACQCRDGCWCRRNACVGHYRLKEVIFDQFLETYVKLWIPPNSRKNVKNAVLAGTSFNGRERNAIQPLKWLREHWSSILDDVRSYDKCGLCYPPGRVEDYVSHRYEVRNLYAAKMWSQLFYDSLVPFDTKSRARIKKAGYLDPTRAYFAMNRELFSDLRALSENHQLGAQAVRQLDSPWMAVAKLLVPAGGQPLSRVVDKIFYSP